jgi:hypothetical protein
LAAFSGIFKFDSPAVKRLLSLFDSPAAERLLSLAHVVAAATGKTIVTIFFSTTIIIEEREVR